MYLCEAIGAAVSTGEAKAFVAALRADSASVGGASNCVSAVSIISASASQSGSRIKMNVAEDCSLRQDHFRISSSGSCGSSNSVHLSDHPRRICPISASSCGWLSASSERNFLPLGIDYYPLDYSADLDMCLSRLIFGNPLFEVSPFADFVGVAGLSLLHSSANASANGAFSDWVGRHPSISNPILFWEHIKASSAEHMLASVGVGGAFLVKADWASVAVEYGFFLLRWGSSIAVSTNCPSFGVMSDMSVGVNVLSAFLAVAESARFFFLLFLLFLLGFLLGFIVGMMVVAILAKS